MFVGVYACQNATLLEQHMLRLKCTWLIYLWYGSLLRSAVGWHMVYDCGTSWSNSLTFAYRCSSSLATMCMYIREREKNTSL